MRQQMINCTKNIHNKYLTAEMRLYPEQLVVEAIDVMLSHEQYELPLYYNNNRVVIIRFKDLIEFLTDNVHGHNMLFHKLNFTIKSAASVLVRKKGDLRSLAVD